MLVGLQNSVVVLSWVGSSTTFLNCTILVTGVSLISEYVCMYIRVRVYVCRVELNDSTITIDSNFYSCILR